MGNFSDQHFDLVIIGGGIMGAGIAREASIRGMKVILLEKNDFASGTSSRSSKLIHGGIRYLANLEFNLVFESLQERSNLFEMAPNLVWPARFVLPVYKGEKFGMNKMGIGMMLYDLFVGINPLPPHRRLCASETMNIIPILKKEDLTGSFVYSDAYTDDSRLVIETIRSAKKLGAVCLSYSEVVSFKKENGKIVGVNAKSEGRTFEVSGKHFVSAVGPWTDIFAKNNLEDWKNFMKPSKGIHITLDRSRLKLDSSVVMVDSKNSRIVFCMVRNDMIIIGTTDTHFEGRPDDVSSTSEDINYLVRMFNTYFPGAKIEKQDIIASFSGVRPLVDDGQISTNKVSRELKIIKDPRNITFIAGGKFTNFRKTAYEVVDSILNTYSFKNYNRFNPVSHRSLEVLNPKATSSGFLKSKNLIPLWQKETGLSLEEVEYLQKRYYMETEDILSYKVEPYNIISLEVEHSIRNLMCFHLVDFFLRRTSIFYSLPDNAQKLYSKVANQMAQRLGWSESQTEHEILALKNHLLSEMKWKNN